MQFSKTSPLKSGESSEKSSGENRVKSCHVCGCLCFFALNFTKAKAKENCRDLIYCVSGLLLWLVRAQHDHYESKCERISGGIYLHFHYESKSELKISRFSFVIVSVRMGGFLRYFLASAQISCEPG